MKISQTTRDKHDFQQPVDPDLLTESLSNALSDHKISSVEELPDGLFNNTYKVTTDRGKYILKISPASQSLILYNERHLMQREMSISPALQGASPLIPCYYVAFKIGGRDAFLQRFVEGRLWHAVSAELSEQENTILWTQLGMFAKTLHSIKGQEFGYPSPFSGHATWASFITENVAELIQDCKNYSICYPEVTKFQAHLQRLLPKLDEVTTPKLIHGDLWPRNVIISGTGESIRIEAVVDGERAYWGDPISDWVLILYDLPPAFWQGYGEDLLASTDPIRIALYRGMYFIVNILEENRVNASDAIPRQNLVDINAVLEKAD